MPISLLNEWGAYISMSPLLKPSYKQSRADWNAAMIATVIRNVIAATHYKDPSYFEIDDVIFKEKAASKSPTEIYSLFKSAVLMTSHVNDQKKN